MPRNTYFTFGRNSERQLFQSLISEAVKFAGMDCRYIPREIIQLDTILNEDTISNFSDSYLIEMWNESFDGFAGEGSILSKYGLEIREQITLVVSRNRWTESVGRYDENLSRPREGDLIYVPFPKMLVQVKYVDVKKPLAQLGGEMIWRVVCETYEYENHKIDTGIVEIDSIRDMKANKTIVDVEYATTTGRFRMNESVTLTLPSTLTATCEVISIEGTRLGLSAITFQDKRFHELAPATIITNADGVEAEITFVHTTANSDDSVIFKNDPAAQNASFDNAAVELIEFNESNPFGNF